MRLMLHMRLLKFFPGNPRVLECHSFLQGKIRRRLCVFAGFSRSGVIEDYVLSNLKALHANGFDIIYVTTAASLNADDLKALSALCIRVLRRKNTGYDFGSWKAGLFYAGVDIDNYDQLLLTNDSYYGPLFPWQDVFAKAQSDLFGITDSSGIRYHLMSYFVFYNTNALHSTQFRRYWQDVRMIPTLLKTLVIYAYEVGMSQKFQRDGFSIGAYCTEKALATALPGSHELIARTIIVHRFWRELIEIMHCPILKVDVFWRVLNGGADASWREVLRRTSYDVTLIDLHQQKLRQ